MNTTSSPRIIRCLSIACLVLGAGSALAGPMTPPPGAPGATMKTLVEVEPRTAINATNTPGDADSVYRITQPGSYYLTGDLVGAAGKHTVQIESGDVTIDLNGFSMRGVGAGGRAFGDHGIDELPSLRGVRIMNGSVVDHTYGVSSSHIHGLSIENVSFSNGYAGVSATGTVTIRDCTFSGFTGSGADLDGAGATVRNCSFISCGLGLYASGTLAQGCFVRSCTDGISMYAGAVIDCVVEGSADEAISLNYGSSAVRCIVTGGTTGIECIAARTSVRECSVQNVTGDAIRVGVGPATVTENTARLAGSAGIRVLVGATRVHVEGNTGTDNLTGVYIAGTDCTIVRNTFGRNTNAANATFFFAPGNRYGTVVKANTNAGNVNITAATGTSAGTFTATDPYSNLSF